MLPNSREGYQGSVDADGSVVLFLHNINNDLKTADTVDDSRGIFHEENGTLVSRYGGMQFKEDQSDSVRRLSKILSTGKFEPSNGEEICN